MNKIEFRQIFLLCSDFEPSKSDLISNDPYNATFPQILEGYERAVGVVETFQKDQSVKCERLKELTTYKSKGGSFPDLEEELHKFAAMFDRDKARKEGKTKVGWQVWEEGRQGKNGMFGR